MLLKADSYMGQVKKPASFLDKRLLQASLAISDG
jgi:hypothetical protein